MYLMWGDPEPVHGTPASTHARTSVVRSLPSCLPLPFDRRRRRRCSISLSFSLVAALCSSPPPSSCTPTTNAAAPTVGRQFSRSESDGQVICHLNRPKMRRRWSRSKVCQREESGAYFVPRFSDSKSVGKSRKFAVSPLLIPRKIRPSSPALLRPNDGQTCCRRCAASGACPLGALSACPSSGRCRRAFSIGMGLRKELPTSTKNLHFCYCKDLFILLLP